jgi:hypothetical protein
MLEATVRNIAMATLPCAFNGEEARSAAVGRYVVSWHDDAMRDASKDP